MNASHIITQATHYKTRFVMNRVVFIWAIMNLPKCQILKLLALSACPFVFPFSTVYPRFENNVYPQLWKTVEILLSVMIMRFFIVDYM